MHKLIVPFIIILFVVTSSFSVSSNSITFIQHNGPMNSPWPMHSHDVLHTGQSQYSTTNNNGAELWKYKTIGWMEAGIAINKEGILYFGDESNYLYAVYPNGTLKWRVQISGAIWSTPALAEEGTIYIGCFGGYDDNFYAFNPDGSVKWTFHANHSIGSSPAIAKDGTIYFGTMGSTDRGCRLFALNPDGSMKWYYQMENKITSSPAIGKDGTIYIGSMDSYLYALYPNGTLKWKYKTGDEIHCHPSIGPDGTIYVGSNDYYLYAMYPNGTLYWKYKINSTPYSNVAIGIDGTIYCPDHSLYAFNPDGILKWIFDFEDDYGVSYSSPAISKEGIIFLGITKQGSNGGQILSINSNGTLQWKREISNYAVGSSPSIGFDGTVYIGSVIDDYPNGWFGYVYAFGEGNVAPEIPTITGPQNGKIRESYTYIVQAMDSDNDHLFYYVDWGDGSNSGWQGPYASGTAISLTYTWLFQGTYPVKAKAKDEQGLESDWVTLEVSMPKMYLYSSIVKIFF